MNYLISLKVMQEIRKYEFQVVIGILPGASGSYLSIVKAEQGC